MNMATDFVDNYWFGNNGF